MGNQQNGDRRWPWKKLCAAVACAALAALFVKFFVKDSSSLDVEIVPGRPYQAIPTSFDGSSGDLRQTIVVPTLDSAIPDTKSAIWCASFQIAWNRLRHDVAHGDLRIEHADKVAERLNHAPESEEDLVEGSYYAAAGFARHGILEKIHADMVRNFPDWPAPRLSAPPQAAVAYAFLRGGVKYTIPYFQGNEPLPFTDTLGRIRPVTSFGIRREEECGYQNLRDQVGVLCGSSEMPPKEFIVDVCRDSQPNQLVLARIDRKSTLAETLAAAQAKVAQYARHLGDFQFKLGQANTFLVPNMHWRIEHHFRELEGEDKRFANPPLRGLFLDVALQALEFKMDRSGAELSTEARIVTKAAGYGDLNCDRPFLLYMQKRGARHPFFVMWVDNAELMCKSPDSEK